MTTCLVTGGAGFIGAHLTRALLARRYHVRVLDNFSTGSRANLDRLPADRLEVIEGDLTRGSVARRAMAGVEVVFHQAALPSVPRSIQDPAATHHVCATGTLEILQAAREANVKRVVYAASSSAYGNSERLPKRESDPTNPLSPYAVAKLAGEQYCASFSNVYGLETVRLRYFNVYGPGQSPDSQYAAVIPKFITSCLRGESPLIYGDGTQSRDFTFVEDVVQANLLAAAAPGVSGRVYNVACGKRISLLNLLAALNDLLGTRIVADHAAARPGDVLHSLADIAQAQKDLAYQPKVDIYEGLKRCLEYYSAMPRAMPTGRFHQAAS